MRSRSWWWRQSWMWWHWWWHHSPQCSRRAHQQTHQWGQASLRLTMMGLMMVVVAVVIPTRRSLPRLCQVQPYCADIQVFIGYAQIDISSYTTYLNVQNELIHRLINKRNPVVEYNGVNNSCGCSNDFDRKFHLRLKYDSRATHLNAQNELTNKLIM